MRKFIRTGVTVLGLAAIGFALIGPASAMVRADQEGSGGNIHAYARPSASVAIAHRAQTVLVDAEGSGADVRATTKLAFVPPADSGGGRQLCWPAC